MTQRLIFICPICGAETWRNRIGVGHITIEQVCETCRRNAKGLDKNEKEELYDIQGDIDDDIQIPVVKSTKQKKGNAKLKRRKVQDD